MRGSVLPHDIVYQLYPRSFMDSNGDGIGDLGGILSKVDYLASLGITMLWLNPIYQSPQRDAGYDISDYQAIDPVFGTMEDFDRLVEALHARGIRLVMDLVANHCSDQHPWFQRALADPSCPERDYFYWKAGRGDGPPNNWQSIFGGPAWTRVGDYWYLHLFAKEQPDLNWENPDLRQAMIDMMNFWLSKGVDGFRLDAITFISKEPGLRDLRPGEAIVSMDGPYVNGPRIREFLEEMHRKAFDPHGAVIMAEAPGVYLSNALDYLGGPEPLFDMLFTSDIIDLDRSPQDKYVAKRPPLALFKETLAAWQTKLHGKGGNCFFWTNHDQPRTLSRFGTTGSWRTQSAKALIMVQLSLDGTPFIYQGDELGMINTTFTRDECRDIDALQYLDIQKAAGIPEHESLARIAAMGRDNARTPLAWTPGLHGGFSEVEPWIKFSEDPRELNVQEQEHDSESVLSFTKAMVGIRAGNKALQSGNFELVLAHDPYILSYTRAILDETVLVVVNMSQNYLGWLAPLGARLILCTKSGAPDPQTLQPWEGRIYGI